MLLECIPKAPLIIMQIAPQQKPSVETAPSCGLFSGQLYVQQSGQPARRCQTVAHST